MKTKHIFLAGAVLLLAALGNAAHALTLSLRPTDDAEAASDKPSSNFGYNGTLRVDTKRTTYLKFDLAALSGATVESATLRLYAANSGSGTQTVRKMAEVPWTEGTLTWNNRPTSVQATVGTFGRTTQKRWVSVDSKSAAINAAGGKLTLSIVGTSKSTLYLSSGEATSNQPELVVVYSKPTEPPPPVSLGVGINLAPPGYSGTEVPFIDLMKLSDGWHTQCDRWSGKDEQCTQEVDVWDTQQIIGGVGQREQDDLNTRLDSNDWPTSLPSVDDTSLIYTRVATLIPAGLSPAHPSDKLVVRYPGSGDVQYKFDWCSGDVIKGFDKDDPSLHRDELTLSEGDLQSKVHVIIASTDSGNPIRNIQVTPSGGVCSNDATQQCVPGVSPSTCPNQANCDAFEDVAADRPFHPRFLANIKPFTQIRTMEFQNLNESKVSTWSNRTQPSNRRWTAHDYSDGVPLEVITQLAKTLGVDLWLNVPSQASDDLVSNMADLVSKELKNTQLRLTLEYSNEAWNTAFGTNGPWIEAQGVATWPTATDHPYLKRLNWYGKRAGEVCKLWKTAWEIAGSARARVTCVAGGQSASPDFTRIMLDCPLSDHPCHEDIDSLAIAPYFGYYLGSPTNAPVVASWPSDLNTLFNELNVGGTSGLSDAPAGGAVNQALSELNSQLVVARDRGLTLCGYEAGQHLVGFGGAENNDALTARFTAANRDPRMGQIYLSYLQRWQESGAGPVMLFNSAGSYGKWGSWGLLEYRNQDRSSSAKYKAVVQDFLGQPLP